jgi:hypothetical protein
MNTIITPLEPLAEHHRRQVDDIDGIARDIKEFEVSPEDCIELSEAVYHAEPGFDGEFGHDLRIAIISS